MEEQQLSQLEELAKAATPGPWECMGRLVEDSNNYVLVRALEAVNTTGHDNAEYIAAANPTTTLALIEEIRRLRATTVPVVGEAGTLRWDIQQCLTGMEQVFRAAQEGQIWSKQVNKFESSLAYLRDILSTLSASPTLEGREEKWISVDDELPPTQKRTANGWEWHESERVLAIEKGEKKAGLYWCDEKGQWRQCGLEFHGHYAQVTHWQPLPTPPAAPTEKERPQ